MGILYKLGSKSKPSLGTYILYEPNLNKDMDITKIWLDHVRTYNEWSKGENDVYFDYYEILSQKIHI